MFSYIPQSFMRYCPIIKNILNCLQYTKLIILFRFTKSAHQIDEKLIHKHTQAICHVKRFLLLLLYHMCVYRIKICVYPYLYWLQYLAERERERERDIIVSSYCEYLRCLHSIPQDNSSSSSTMISKHDLKMYFHPVCVCVANAFSIETTCDYVACVCVRLFNKSNSPATAQRLCL